MTVDDAAHSLYDCIVKTEKKFSEKKIVTLDDFLKYFSDKNIRGYI